MGELSEFVSKQSSVLDRLNSQSQQLIEQVAMQNKQVSELRGCVDLLTEQLLP